MTQLAEYEARTLTHERRARDLRDLGLAFLGIIMVWLLLGRVPGWGTLGGVLHTLPLHIRIPQQVHLPVWGALVLLAAVASLVEFERVIVVFVGIALGQFIPVREPWVATAWFLRELPTVGVTVWCLSALIQRGLWWWTHKWRVLAMGDADVLALLLRDVVIGLGLAWGGLHLLPECFAAPAHAARAVGLGWHIALIGLFTIVTAKAELDRAYSAEIRPPLLEHLGLSVTTRTDEVVSRALSLVSVNAKAWLFPEENEAQRRKAQPASSAEQPREVKDSTRRRLPDEEQKQEKATEPAPSDKPRRGVLQRLSAWLLAED